MSSPPIPPCTCFSCRIDWVNSSPKELELGICSYYDFLSDGDEKMKGWSKSYLAHIAARLGLGEEAECQLQSLQKYYILPGLLSSHEPVQENAIFQIEALLAVTTAMNEMVLQSVDGVIRVFPAVPKNRSCSFRDLLARGNVLVSAEKFGEEVGYVQLEPTQDRTINLVSPWMGTELLVNGESVEIHDGREVLDGRRREILYLYFHHVKSKSPLRQQKMAVPHSHQVRIDSWAVPMLLFVFSVFSCLS